MTYKIVAVNADGERFEWECERGVDAHAMWLMVEHFGGKVLKVDTDWGWKR